MSEQPTQTDYTSPYDLGRMLAAQEMQRWFDTIQATGQQLQASIHGAIAEMSELRDKTANLLKDDYTAYKDNLRTVSETEIRLLRTSGDAERRFLYEIRASSIQDLKAELTRILAVLETLPGNDK